MWPRLQPYVAGLQPYLYRYCLHPLRPRGLGAVVQHVLEELPVARVRQWRRCRCRRPRGRARNAALARRATQATGLAALATLTTAAALAALTTAAALAALAALADQAAARAAASPPRLHATAAAAAAAAAAATAAAAAAAAAATPPPAPPPHRTVCRRPPHRAAVDGLGLPVGKARAHVHADDRVVGLEPAEVRTIYCLATNLLATN